MGSFFFNAYLRPQALFKTVAATASSLLGSGSSDSVITSVLVQQTMTQLRTTATESNRGWHTLSLAEQRAVRHRYPDSAPPPMEFTGDELLGARVSVMYEHNGRGKWHPGVIVECMDAVDVDSPPTVRVHFDGFDATRQDTVELDMVQPRDQECTVTRVLHPFIGVLSLTSSWKT